MPEIKHETTINAAPSRVYDALTRREHLAAWWNDCTGDHRAGHEIVFHMEGDRGMARMRIQRLEPDRLVEWECLEHDYQGVKDWTGTTIRFELKPIQGGTIVDFAHLNWKDREGCYDLCVAGWEYFVKKSLKEYLETGKGAPDQCGLKDKLAENISAARK